MGFKSFRLNVSVRCLVLACFLLLLFYLLTRTELYATSALVLVVAAYQIYALIHFVEKTNRELTRFLLAIRYGDFTQSFSSRGRGRSFDELNTAFSKVVDHLQKIREEKEEQSLYLQTVIQHVGVGLIAFTPEGSVTLINNAAKRILGVNQLVELRSLGRISGELVEVLMKLSSGQKSLVKLEVRGEAVQLIVYATEQKLRGQSQMLISIQNIQSELDEKEMEAWQRLVRVLTHEIMNSLTPISSLASTVNGMLRPGTPDGVSQGRLSAETMRDVTGAVETIEKRSQGLLHFVDAYRNLARIPRPSFGIIAVADLFRRVEQLMHERFSAGRIALSTRVEPISLELTADPELIEQVLINLLSNAAEALADRTDGAIAVEGRMGERGRVIIEVTDNGPGIAKDVQERIFIPFFTTKQNGSGIGLSLSRQIMRLHRGSISVSSDPAAKTTFTLRF